MDERQHLPLWRVSKYRRGHPTGGFLMQPFTLTRPGDVDTAVAVAAAEPLSAFVAGATELANWMKDGIQSPSHLLDINTLPLSDIDVHADAVRLGALARMSDVAAHPIVRRAYPVVSEALELAASPQIRNMAPWRATCSSAPAVRTSARPRSRVTSASRAPAARR